MTAFSRIRMGILFAGLFLACAKVPYTERSQLVTLSETEELRLGDAVFQEVASDGNRIDDARARRITEVGERIAAATGRTDFRWEFLLLESAEANAFALPGGKVVFYSGILPYCEDDDGIAAVMAHEVAHVLARHGAERLSQARLFDLGGAALSAVFAGGSPALQRGVLGAYGVGGRIGVLLPFSRKQEAEADEIGVVLMAKAGYDPRAAPAFWHRLLESGESGPTSEILSTHPSGEERLRSIEELMPIAIEYYRKSDPARRRENASARKPEPSVEEVLKELHGSDPPE